VPYKRYKGVPPDLLPLTMTRGWRDVAIAANTRCVHIPNFPDNDTVPRDDNLVPWGRSSYYYEWPYGHLPVVVVVVVRLHLQNKSDKGHDNPGLVARRGYGARGEEMHRRILGTIEPAEGSDDYEDRERVDRTNQRKVHGRTMTSRRGVLLVLLREGPNFWNWIPSYWTWWKN